MNKRISILAALALGLAASFAACSNDASNPNPSPVGGTGGASSATSSTSKSSSAAGGPTSGASGTTTSGTGAGTGATGAGGGGGCFNGTSTTEEEFLNHCTKAQCAPFTTALPLQNPDGTLPALP